MNTLTDNIQHIFRNNEKKGKYGSKTNTSPTAYRRTDVGLVDLVSHEDDAIFLAEIDNFALVVVVEHVARRVAGVDHHKGSHTLAGSPRLNGQRWEWL